MSERRQSAVLLLMTGVMLAVCLVGLVHWPAQQAEVQGSDTVTYRIDPNRADAATLCLLPRIGPGIAQRIISDREAQGQFRDLSDLTRVSMVGDKTVEALQPWLVFHPRDETNHEYER